MTWNGSAHMTASGHFSLTTSVIQSAESALTWVISRHRSGPSAVKKARMVARLRPGAAQARYPVSWLMTMVRNFIPRR
jgi:hypothetical protein